MFDLGKHSNVLIAVVVVSSLLSGTAAWVSRHNLSARLGVVDLQQLRGCHPRARHLNELASNINEHERFLYSTHCSFGQRSRDYYRELNQQLQLHRQQLAETKARYDDESRQVGFEVAKLVCAEAERLHLQVVLDRPHFSQQTVDLTPSCLLLMQLRPNSH